MVTTITGLTKDRMLRIEAESIVSGLVDAEGNLILATREGEQFNAGRVHGDKGDKGDTGNPGHVVLSSKPATDPPSTYPRDLSTFEFTIDSTWPTSYAVVFSVIRSVARGFQLVSAKNSGRIWMRTVGDDNWSPFYEISSTSYVDSSVGALRTELATTTLGANVNLNTLTSTGTYIQPSNAQASTALNYPEAQAGMLEVIARGPSGTAMVYQRYTLYNPTTTHRTIYARSLHSATWSSWVVIYGPPVETNFAWRSTLYANMAGTTYNDVTKLVKENGRVKFLGGAVRLTTDASVTRGTAYIFGTIPSGWRPEKVNLGFAASYAHPSAVINIYAQPNGEFQWLTSEATGTWGAGQYFILHPMEWDYVP